MFVVARGETSIFFCLVPTKTIIVWIFYFETETK
jgi:hypothetical protein